MTKLARLSRAVLRLAFVYKVSTIGSAGIGCAFFGCYVDHLKCSDTVFEHDSRAGRRIDLAKVLGTIVGI